MPRERFLKTGAGRAWLRPQLTDRAGPPVVQHPTTRDRIRHLAGATADQVPPIVEEPASPGGSHFHQEGAFELTESAYSHIF